MAISIWGPVELIRGPVRCSRALRARCAAPMPPDPVGWRERSRAQRSTHPGARPVLGRFAPCALPMPPDPVGWRERSRAQRSTHPGARPVLGRFAPCALPMPPDPVGWRELAHAELLADDLLHLLLHAGSHYSSLNSRARPGACHM